MFGNLMNKLFVIEDKPIEKVKEELRKEVNIVQEIEPVSTQLLIFKN